jgi:hypothetical protein
MMRKTTNGKLGVLRVVRALIFLLLLAVSGTSAQPTQISFVASAPQIVTSKDELLAAKINLADAGIYALNDQGVLKWWAVGGPLERKGNYRAQVYSTGPREKPYEHIISTTVEIVGVPEPRVDNKGPHGTGTWLTNVYRDPASGHILGFVHTEYAPFGRPPEMEGGWYCRLGLAVSRDKGQSFQWCGYILTPHLSYETVLSDWYGRYPWHCNMGLPCYIMKEGYIYIYYRDTVDLSDRSEYGTAVARARLDEVVAAALKGRVARWHKFHNGAWEEPGIGGKFTSLNIEPKGYMHGDGAYNTHLEKFVLVTRDDLGSKGSALVVSFSDDGIHWSPWQDIHRDGAKYNHPSIISEGEDNELIDDSFWIYYKYKPEDGPSGLGRTRIQLD